MDISINEKRKVAAQLNYQLKLYIQALNMFDENDIRIKNTEKTIIDYCKKLIAILNKK